MTARDVRTTAQAGQLRYWRHRWSPQHVTTVDMTGTINAPQWEPVHVLNDADLAALEVPTREQIVKALYDASCEFPKDGIDPSRSWALQEAEEYADAVLALMQERDSRSS